MGAWITVIIFVAIGFPLFTVASQSERFVEWANRFQQ